ncbi:DUF4062 domain-containing protein [Pseudomonas coleopterorum]|uniref:DUF4062 domain-containing protein n=1 Tax=Pseudomonas coleopterorum TaxID=1605838 RepID=UPI00177EEFF5|nr:DUF4062 domain-containing protein [Pseudomonas coleopterorum]MBD8483983.1 DUF4062 domain-containing protein [Pseudomonas coleopterorum]
MDKRYQVFVSSTYTDLKEERQKVTQTLMEMDCIPAGMELFPAMDEEQWEFIKRVIDDCDYYLLIIGGRYGSIAAEGISYTEKEYDYAVSKGLKIIALLHGDISTLSVANSELSEELRGKLLAFREKAQSSRLVKYWQNGSELPGLVALSLSKTIKLFPATGWVRAGNESSNEILSEINQLRKENKKLEDLLSSLNPVAINEPIPDLALLDELFKVSGGYLSASTQPRIWSVDLTWEKIFFYISPYLIKQCNQESVKEILRRSIVEEYNLPARMSSLNDQVFQTIAIQLKALGLVSIRISKATSGKTLPFWSLTRSGEELMISLRAIKSNVSSGSENQNT